MRYYFSTAPWWILSLLLGTFFGAGMTVFSLVTDSDGWPGAVIGGVMGGMVFGALMGPITARQWRRQRAATGDLSAAEFTIANRAAWRGPVPSDPAMRSAARRTADHALEVTLR